MDGHDCFLGEEVPLSPDNLQVVGEVRAHVCEFQGQEVSTADDAGGEGLGCVEQELVDESALAT